MMVPAYAEVLTQRLPPEVFCPVPSRSLWLLVYAPVVAACTIAIVDLQLNVFAKLALSLMIGLAFSCLGILAHEILHGSVVEARWLRRVLGAVCLAPLAIGPSFWMIWHNTHHAHTQDQVRDPDIWGMIDGVPLDASMRPLKRFTNPYSLMFPIFLSTGVTAHATALLLFNQPRMTRRQYALALIEFLGPLNFWLLLGLWLGWVNWLFFYLVPLLVANVIVNSFVVTNHFLNPLESGDTLSGSLTVTTYRWLEYLLLNFNYHSEHHLLPGMSPKYAPQVTLLLKELWPERYQQMPHGRALLQVWRTPRVYYNEVSLVDLRDGTLYGTLGHGLNETPQTPQLSKSANS